MGNVHIGRWVCSVMAAAEAAARRAVSVFGASLVPLEEHLAFDTAIIYMVQPILEHGDEIHLRLKENHQASIFSPPRRRGEAPQTLSLSLFSERLVDTKSIFYFN